MDEQLAEHLRRICTVSFATLTCFDEVDVDDDDVDVQFQ